MSNPEDNSSNSASPKTEEAPPSIYGDCSIQLKRSVFYEPPFYLFPELLPKVPQGSPPVKVWDKVADAVDVNTSFWSIAEGLNLKGAEEASSVAGAKAKVSGANAVHAEAKTTLAHLVSSSRLLATGLTPEALTSGHFSAAAMVEEIAKFVATAGLNELEGACLMSNQFINLAAWLKLKEINTSAARAAVTTTTTTTATATETATGAKKRGREEEASAMATAKLKPSPDPWSSDVDAPENVGVFISGRESHVEKRIQTLDALTELYRRPWRSLCSQGAQTDYVVPPASVNVTSPFAAPPVPKEVAPREDLGWGPPPPAAATFSLVLRTSTSAAAAGDDKRTVQRVVSLHQLCTTFGRQEGIQCTRGGSVYVDVGLDGFVAAAQAAHVSTHHFSLVLRPSYAATPGTTRGNEKTVKAESSDDDDSEAEAEHEQQQQQQQAFHLKHPRSFSLWLLNYGSNGVQVVAPERQFVLGKAVELKAGSELVVQGVHMTVIHTSEAEQVQVVKTEDGDQQPLTVKKEKTDA